MVCLVTQSKSIIVDVALILKKVHSSNPTTCRYGLRIIEIVVYSEVREHYFHIFIRVDLSEPLVQVLTGLNKTQAFVATH